MNAIERRATSLAHRADAATARARTESELRAARQLHAKASLEFERAGQTREAEKHQREATRLYHKIHARPNPSHPWSTEKKLVVGGGVVAALVALWYWRWGQWQFPIGLKVRTYRGIQYNVSNFLCGLLDTSAPKDKPFCWYIDHNDGAPASSPQEVAYQAFLASQHSPFQYFANGPDANAAAKAWIDQYLGAAAAAR